MSDWESKQDESEDILRSEEEVKGDDLVIWKVKLRW